MRRFVTRLAQPPTFRQGRSVSECDDIVAFTSRRHPDPKYVRPWIERACEACLTGTAQRPLRSAEHTTPEQLCADIAS